MTARTWQNWGRNQRADPARVERPDSVAAVVDVVSRARADGLRVKPVGSGHCFTDVAVTDGVQVRLDRLTGVLRSDPATGLVTVAAGTPLHQLNPALERRGLSMSNLGDIDVQTISGAISTGTHGTGARLGRARDAGPRPAAGAGRRRGRRLLGDATSPDLFAAARVGLGALGVVTAVTLQCEPAFALTAVEAPMPLDGRARGLRRARRRQRPLRVLLVPAHRRRAHQAQQPAAGAGAEASAARRGAALGRRRAAVQRRLRGQSSG